MHLFNSEVTAICMILSLLVLSYGAQPCEAVREGTANANIMIKRYERNQDFARASLWHEAAADCLEIISTPMTKILIRYHLRHGQDEFAKVRRRELADIEAQRRHHLKLAKMYWAKSKTEGQEQAVLPLAAEREKIAQFIATWVPHYPDKFYEFGIYVHFFKDRREGFKRTKEYAAALNIEADAAEMCAEQYNEITIAYFRHEAERSAKAKRTQVAEAYRERAAQYENVRDAHRRRATLLRALAHQAPKAWPAEAEVREIQTPRTKTQLTPEAVIDVARSDARVQNRLKPHQGVHEYAWFQGFAWTVSFYNHGWGNLAIALVDDKTGKVIDVLNPVGNLEAREWQEAQVDYLDERYQ